MPPAGTSLRHIVQQSIPLLGFKEKEVVNMADNLVCSRGACFSSCRNYRYLLWREWRQPSEKTRTVVFVLLNPSKANESDDDGTIKRCLRFSKRKDFNGNRMEVVNLFAWCETESEKLRGAGDDPVGPDNDKYIDAAISRADRVVVGWGRRKKFPKKYRHRDRDVLKLLEKHGKQLYAFCINGDGTPTHPGRYIKDDQELIPYPLKT